MLPNESFGYFSFSPLFQVLVSFYQICPVQNNMFSILLVTDQTPTDFLQVLGSRGAPRRVFSSSTGCSGTGVSLVFKGYLVDTSRNEMLLHTGAIVAAFSSLAQ